MSTALYRRYRPETFAEVIGQDHVTAPLRQALRSGQVNHAYLFSGPRGCGKTTSARILARILNCAANTDASPTDTPCGRCESCVELARGGPGSLDVVEIDAASHGGVDDARELRERATFAPARDRFKIFILDEAHMVTTQGFNALLKIVEEPPPHVKFVFATTEPDKVIGTIRSRTHHYPFRLVPPDVLLPYLEELCDAESVPVGGGVLPLVVRAGGGSVRDSLSVLDQLIAGADEHGIGYEGAAALLGYTQSSLLDDLVDAIAARDGGAAFRVVERVIATGHEPRRFVEDLLERLRDLIVIDAAGEAAGAALRGLPQDQLESMRIQSARLGASELSRSADLVNAALTEMTGATSPRLHLELLMARLLLPAADDDRTGLAARLDRLERGAPVSSSPSPHDDAPAARPSPAPAPASSAPQSAGGPSLTTGPTGAAAARAALAAQRTAAAAPPSSQPPPTTSAPTSATGSETGSATRSSGPSTSNPTSDPTPAPAAPDVTGPPPWDVPDDEAAAPVSVHVAAPTDEPADSAVAGGETAERAGTAGTAEEPDEPAPNGPADHGPLAAVGPGTADDEQAPEIARAALDAPVEDAPFQPAPAGVTGETETLRRRWPEVLDTVRSLRRVTGALVDPNNAQVAELDATTLRLAFTTPELATTFRNGPHADVVAQAVRETLGFDVRVEAVGGPGGAGSGAPDGPPRAMGSGRAQSPTQRPTAGRPPAGPETRAPRSRPGGSSGRPAGPAEPGASDDDADPHRAPAPDAGADARGARPAPAGASASTADSSADSSSGSAVAGSVGAAAGSDWEPPEEPDDPWATPVPTEPRSAAADNAGPSPDDVPEARRQDVPVVPGVISAADAAASWDLPPSGTPGAARGAATALPAPATSIAATSIPATPVPAASAAAAPPVGRREQAGAPPGTGPRAVSAAESAVARAQRLAAAAPQRSSSPAARPAPPPAHDPYDDLSPDDPDMASSGLVGAPLIAQLLGGTVIDEQVDDGRS